MHTLLMTMNNQLNEANGVLATVARERAADAASYQRLAEQRLQTIHMMAETIRKQDEAVRSLTDAYVVLADELL